jgi:hypothetical protein
MATGLVFAPNATVRFSPALGWWRLKASAVTRMAMAEEINRTARLARTQIRRKLAQQTLIPYGEVASKVYLLPASSGRLEARIRVRDRAQTLGRFMTSYTKRPGSWRKKGWRQTMRLKVGEGGKRFPYSGTKKPFVIEGKKLIAIRTGQPRLPIKILSGPHLPNETLRQGKATGTYVRVTMPSDFSARVIARIHRIMGA